MTFSSMKDITLREIDRVLNGKSDNIIFNNRVSGYYYYYHDCVSLLDISKLFSSMHQQRKKNIELAESKTQDKVEKKTNDLAFIFVEKFSYGTKTLCVDFWDDNDFLNLKFYKKKNISHIKVMNCDNVKKQTNEIIFPILKEEFDKICEEFYKFEDVYRKNVYGIKSVNCNFHIDICSSKIIVYLPDLVYEDDKYFDSRYETAWDEINYSKDTFTQIKGLNRKILDETNLLKEVFVNISDCPEWMHEHLRKTKEQNIKKESRKENIKRLVLRK